MGGPRRGRAGVARRASRRWLAPLAEPIGGWKPGGVFERFTDRARRVLVLAQEEARLLGHPFIGTEHILLGLVHEGEGVAAQALATLGISLDEVRARVEEIVSSGGPSSGSPPFTPRAKKVLELSLREALQLGHNYIGTEHILLGMVREGEGVGAVVLTELGGDLARVRAAVMTAVSGFGDVRLTAVQTGRLVSCTFCGRRPPDSGQLVAGRRDTFICEHCVALWATRLAVGPGHEGHVPDEAPEPGGAPPADQDGARAEITAAFAHLGPSGDDPALPNVEGGEHLVACVHEARRRHPDAAGRRPSVGVDDIAFVDAEHAAVWFTISLDGSPVLVRRRGDAVVVEGGWKVARSTFCDLLALAGVPCPPEAG